MQIEKKQHGQSVARIFVFKVRNKLEASDQAMSLARIGLYLLSQGTIVCRFFSSLKHSEALFLMWSTHSLPLFSGLQVVESIRVPSIIFTHPSTRAGYDIRSIFKRSLAGLNSEFSFS